MPYFASAKWFLILISFAICLALSGTWNSFASEKTAEDSEQVEWAAIEEVHGIDNDDIEEKVDAPVKMAQDASSGRGVIWGKKKEAVVETQENSISSAEKETKSTAKENVENDVAEAKPKTANIADATKLSEKVVVNRPATTPAASIPPASIDTKNLKEMLEESSETIALDKPAAKETFSGKAYLLKSSRKVGSCDLVETLLEVKGDLKQTDADLKSVSEKMEVVAGFRYEERIQQFSESGSNLASLRQYNLAKAKMKFGQDVKTPELDEKLQTIVCVLDKEKVTLFSPKGALRGEQLLLIEDLPGNTLTLDRLLPGKSVKIGETWKISDSVLRSFLSVDAIVESNVDAILTAVADNMAMVEIIGDVSGIYLGAATEMTVKAKYQFDLSTSRINWLGLLIEEDRSVGHVGPALNLVARLQVKISPTSTPEQLTDELLSSIDLNPSDSVLKLKYDGGKGPWRFSHDRDWYVFQDDAQTTILRKLYRGELVAQCNIADMGKVDVKTMSSIKKFASELETGLGKSFGRIVSSEEIENRFGYKDYLVQIDGIVDDLKLRWIYHLLTDEAGNQSVIVFVVESEMLEQFGQSDQALLNTYRMGKK
ncbi:MAG: hypothetical protein ACRCUY_10275 [Thermoguttaceae bacterium]